MRIEHEGREYLVLSAPLSPTTVALPSSLSPAETEVVRLALAGLSNERIGLATKRSVRTVANLLARACRKLGVRRRTELAAIIGRGSKTQTT